VKLWRRTLESPVFENPKLLKFWLYCLMKASHKKHTAMVGLQVVELEPGQFIFGRKIAAKETKLSQQSIRTFLKILKNLQNLTIKSTNKFSVITIVNWDTYQQEEKISTIKSTSSQPASNQQVTTYKNVKNVKNGDNNSLPSTPPPVSLPAYPDEICAFVDSFIAHISETKPTLAPKAANLRESSLDVVDKLIRLDGFTLEEIMATLRWAIKDEFWSGNVLSLAGLRKKKDGLTKFQKIKASYGKAGRKSSSSRSEQNKQACSSFIQRMREKRNGE